MALGIGVAGWAAIAGTAVSAYSAVDSADKSRSAKNKAKDQAVIADEQFNKANGKRPDTGAMMADNALSASAGQSGTLLTGPAGVDPNKLLLGKTTLLGG